MGYGRIGAQALACRDNQEWTTLLRMKLRKGTANFTNHGRLTTGTMQKISLTNRLRQIRRIRILTVLACIVLLFFIGQIIISKNPKNSKASPPSPPAGVTCTATPDADGAYTCTVNGAGYGGTCNTATAACDMTLPNTIFNGILPNPPINLVIDGAVRTSFNVNVTGLYSFNNLTVRKATLQTTDINGINLAITNSLIQFPNGNIIADGTTGSVDGKPITITAKKIMQTATSTLISSKGLSAGGNGGVIKLTADVLSSNVNALGPIVIGQGTGVIGITNISDLRLGNINASAGQTSGNGNGGTAILNFKAIRNLCYVNSGTNVSATCENGDIIIDGDIDNDGVVEGLTINADTVQVWQQGNTGHVVGDDCTGQSTEQYCDSKRHFASLMIINGTKLTHQAVTVTDMAQDTDGDGSLADNIAGTARWKKVDLAVEEDIVLDSGGSIDVIGMGYPTATVEPAGNDTAYINNSSFGPGKGAGIYMDDGGHSAIGPAGGGGAYGGDGGVRWEIPTPTVITRVLPAQSYPAGYIATISNVNFEWGSSGGWARASGDSTSIASGGNGGGRIHLRAENIYILNQSSSISANGGDGHYTNNCCGRHAYGGAGAGGTIWMEIYKVSFSDTAGMPVMNSNAGVGADCTEQAATNFDNCSYGGSLPADFTTGQSGTIDFIGSFDNSAFANITVTGGNTVHSTYWGTGNGGGGRIIIKKLDYYPDATVKKVLTPLERPLGTANTSFNPYSLQKGDKIKVYLYVSGVPVGDVYTLTDDWLSTGTLSFCQPISGATMSPTPTSGLTATPLVWKKTSTSVTLDTVYYQCTVQ